MVAFASTSGPTLVSDGTNLYFATLSALQKIVASSGANTTLVNNKVFTTLTYGNGVLYAADQDAIFSVHVTTGVLAEIVKMPGITEMAYIDVDNIIVKKGNSLINVTISTGAYTYITQTL